jgi:DNA-binding NtrC family response regulator
LIPEGKQVLVIDEPGAGAETQSVLASLGLGVTLVQDAQTALQRAAREEFDLAVLSAGLGAEAAADLLPRLRAAASIPSLVILARPEEARQAIEALAQGADDYLLRPLDPVEVQARIGRILRWQDLDAQVVSLQKEMSRRYLLGNLVCRSAGMRRVREQILQVAAARSTVLILGESGVGKELVAKAIHYNSPRRAAPFVAINCSAIPATLIESELFGHERGAFTGAIERRKGKFELAHGGTILLDEIGEMDLATQAKLLRVLEEREFMRVGGGREVRVDVRVLAATNGDLEEMVARRLFREDLYFRLKVISIRVPPLRERGDDIPGLARVFMQQIARDNGLAAKQLTGKAVRGLQRYAWPGNVRELKNVLESTLITRPGRVIRWGDLPPAVRGAAALAPRGEPGAGLTLREAERSLIRRTLIAHGGNRTHAARALSIGVRTLQRKIKAYGVQVAAGRRFPAPPQKSTETPRPGASASGRM